MSRGGAVRTAGGRQWTRRQLKLALATAFGTAERGGPDTAAAAAALGISRRSVQRYLHGDERKLAVLPAGRLEQIRRAVRPDEHSLRQEQIAERYARDAIDRIAQPDGGDVLPAWRERQWLEPHVVAVLDLPGLRLRQVTVSRDTAKTLGVLARRGKVLNHTTVPSRFHATVLAHAVLGQVDQWRIQTPPAVVRQGRTQTWSAGAPPVDLEELAVTAGLTSAPSSKDSPDRPAR